MASYSVELEAVEQLLSKDDAKKHKALIDAIKKASQAGEKAEKEIEKWKDSVGSLEVPLRAAQNEAALADLKTDIKNFLKKTEVIDGAADAALKGSSPKAHKPLAGDAQKLYDKIIKKAPAWESKLKSNLTKYATAENAAQKVGREWLVRLQALSKAGKDALKTLEGPSVAKLEKPIKAVIVKGADDRVKALAAIGA